MNVNEISRLFSRFTELKILVIGDVMLDNYTWGKVERISPEAPVPVVSVIKHESRLGGAANVALNLKALGATVVLAGVTGNDRSGDIFNSLLEEEKLSTIGILRLNRPTTIKTRIIGNNHQLLRIDEEDDSFLNEEDAGLLKEKIMTLFAGQTFHAIIFEDYDKGLINPELISVITDLARTMHIPVAADPKKRNFCFYKKVDLFKPNLKEINEGLKTQTNPKDQDSVRKAHKSLKSLLDNGISLITLSESGIFAGGEGEEYFIPAQVRTINDVSGAGDTVISTATLCLAAGADLETIAWLSNLAGGSVCEKVGVVPVDAAQLEAEAIELISKNSAENIV